MPNILDEYLIKLGAVVDTAGMGRFQNALREASQAVDAQSFAMAKSFFKAQTEIVGGFAAIGGAALGLADKVATADQEYRLFALHMYMSKDAARSLKIAMDDLGQPLENLAWDAELRERTRQLIQDQRAMSVGGDFDAQMRKIRDVRFEFTRMQVELQYLGMRVVGDFMTALGLGPDTLLAKLRQFNDWVIHNLPEISHKLVTMFLPVWKDIKEVFAATAMAVKDTADAFSDVVGLLTGDSAIVRATSSFDKFGLAIQRVSHVFAVFAETVADLEDLLAHLLSALADVATGNLGQAGQELKGALGDLNARTLGALAMAGTALVAPELLPEEAEGGGAAALFGRLLGFAAKHPVLSGGLGANFGDMLSPGGDASQALVAAVIGQESGGNPDALSYKGAVGPMQLMPGTAASLGVNPYDPAQNIAGGTAYLNQLLRKYGGDVPEALGAYNAGPGRMDAFLAGKATLPSETRDYISRVLGRAGQSGSVQVGSVVINITQPGASPSQIQRSVTDGISDAANKRIQRNLLEFQSLGTGY